MCGTKSAQGPNFKKGASRSEGGRAVVSRLTGAIVRAILVMAVVATPSALLPELSADTKQMVALVALFAGLLVFVEYKATYPGLIEFRDAPPFNRIRYAILLLTVFCLSILEAGRIAPTTLTSLVEAVALLIGRVMDFPYSPVRLATLMLAQGATPAQTEVVRSAAALAYVIAAVGVLIFGSAARGRSWPGKGGFNVWVNLPTFDPTSGSDVITRLDQDARVNVALGILLPFLTPVAVRYGFSGIDALTLTSPQTLIWTVAAWSFIPASLFMRGLAMRRIADMIREKRRANETAGAAALAAV
jgi:hypothetical protein